MSIARVVSKGVKLSQHRYWLSYDLGLHGSYDEMYQWLDERDAKECGDSVATFVSSQNRDSIKNELKKLLRVTDRVYLIDMKNGGTFVSGKRKPAPWAGYAQTEMVEVET